MILVMFFIGAGAAYAAKVLQRRQCARPMNFGTQMNDRCRVRFATRVSNWNVTSAFICCATMIYVGMLVKCVVSQWWRQNLIQICYEFFCLFLGKTFRMHSHLSNHRETHNTVNSIECQLCKQMFKTSVTLKSHMRQVHTQNHAYKCSICNRGFYRRNKLKVSKAV